MNALLQFTADRATYVAANIDRITQKIARSEDGRRCVMGDLGGDTALALALSVNDDAELGRVFRAAFWRGVAALAADCAEDEYHMQGEGLLYVGAAPRNPISQSDED